jgi:hypothetical protein
MQFPVVSYLRMQIKSVPGYSVPLEIIMKNPNVFLRKPNGTNASSTWEGKWIMDPTTPETEAYMKALFAWFRDSGYDYLKIDGQPLVADEYNAKQQFMLNNPAESGADKHGYKVRDWRIPQAHSTVRRGIQPSATQQTWLDPPPQ